MDFPSRNERRFDRLTAINFQDGDPGKRVDALIPTPLWKLLREVAARDGLTIGAAAQLALSKWTRSNV